MAVFEAGYFEGPRSIAGELTFRRSVRFSYRKRARPPCHINALATLGGFNAAFRFRTEIFTEVDEIFTELTSLEIGHSDDDRLLTLLDGRIRVGTNVAANEG
jgi:hypothetical protein